jgi:hypothetical protein
MKLKGTNTLVVLSGLLGAGLLAGCLFSNDNSGSSADSLAARSKGSAVEDTSDWGKGGVGKRTVCHIPPGNPANAHSISVGEPAVRAHLAHGDRLGACPDPTSKPICHNPKTDTTVVDTIPNTSTTVVDSTLNNT